MTKRISDPILEQRIGSLPQRLESLVGTDSVRQFALKTEVSEGAIRKILKGSIPGIETAAKLANACGVSLDWLITGSEPETKLTYDSSVHVIDEPELNLHPNMVESMRREYGVEIKDNLSDEFVLIPGYHIQVSAGNGCNAFDAKPKRWLAFRKKYLQYRGLNPYNCVIVFVKGDSMADTITDNDSLLIDTSARTPIDGQIYVVRLGDELYAKRIQKSFDGSLILISDNKDYSPITVPKEQLDQLCVVGKVVQRSTDL
ncbi:LexA family transcriptional regulator [Vibrio parahaemolyticus]|uniref:XRE family transcriptional regulator n=1 Tax=Vibrio parahaemolyticus TaxID=670 RepID=UPI000E068D63|nr:LexA family transcriptional regulator [Vibrio parahaemolyticus]EJG1710657.1 LexA family transcriptional regulator [Vibrio parahaemolyticus]EJG1744034.1 LexA family transcriptional regulator [Vibrio parahaemolyticus]EJG1781748.1 LexA family transcriptional regulator [Vibrio parahaemolyticus]SUP22923.1 transcriptional regulator,Cro/CI family [Vibrio parahaemolyticus]SUQ25688.1 transcriptional regulator,Cro/CI family [Vibrio parahaemolyticus]